MYPWHESLSSWAKGTGLRIDALGLVTLLGAEEMDRNIGRLMPSDYFDYLPLLGAFVVAGDRFTDKKTGFILYNISAGILTTELAGWVSRWVRAQDLYKVRSKVTWEVADRPFRWTKFFFGFILIGLPLHGMLLALTVLSADWWGFANVVSMILSVVVRCGQVHQNQAGIDANIEMAEKEAQAKMTKYEGALQQFEDWQRTGPSTETRNPPSEPKDFHDAKVLMVTEDSNILTLVAPNYLVKAVFTTSPRIPNPLFYLTCRAIGWAAFAVHVISIGMAELPIQICSVVLIIVATVLTAYKVGSGDSKIWKALRNRFARGNEEDESLTCWVTSRLKATISSYSEEWSVWTEEEREVSCYQDANLQKGSLNKTGNKQKTFIDIESLPTTRKREPIQERRQDLYAWLDLTEEQDKCLVAWGLIPHNNDWQNAYQEKKTFHRQREIRRKAQGTE
jgi:hypothetical protein